MVAVFMRPVLMTLIMAVCSPVSDVSAAPQNAPISGPVPNWYVHGIIAALLDPTPGALTQVLQLPRVAEALAAIGRIDELEWERQRKTVIDTLVKLAVSNDRDVQESVAAALGAISDRDAEQPHRRMPRMMMDRKVSPATATVTARDH
jgi:hypothetical protein